jgi:hypothetical protein
MGHGAGLHVETYAHVLDAVSGQRYESLDALILQIEQSPLSDSNR